MTHKQNEEWLSAAEENFSDALDDENVALAKAIIADTQEAGFSQQARGMNSRLREKTSTV